MDLHLASSVDNEKEENAHCKEQNIEAISLAFSVTALPCLLKT